MDYNKLAKEAHENAVKHGFWEMRVSVKHCFMLIISEISEMVEAHRWRHHANYAEYNGNSGKEFVELIQNTVEDAMADVVILLLDYAGAVKIDFDDWNPSMVNHNFSDYTFIENAFVLTKCLCCHHGVQKRIRFGLEYITKWAKYLGVDLEWHVEEKMKYNAGRPPKHGKAY